MSLRFAFETPDPEKPGAIKTVHVDAPDAIRFDSDKLQAFYDEHRALYPEPPKAEGGNG